MRLILALILMMTALTSVDEGRAETPEIQFGVLNLVPYGFRDKDAPAQGYLHDIAAEMLTRVNVPHVLHLLPLPRLFRDIREGNVTCMFIADVAATRAVATMSEPIGTILRGGVLTRDGQNLRNYEDLYQYEIGVPAGVSFHPRFDADTRLQKTRVPNYKSAVEMLLGNRVDAVIGNIDAFHYYARQRDVDPDMVFSKPLLLQEAPMKLACSKASPPDEKHLDAMVSALRWMRQGGTVRSILERYDSTGSLDPAIAVTQ